MLLIPLSRLRALTLAAALLGALVPRGVAQVSNGSWIYPSPTGNLLYQLDERGQRIADFSHCGYRGGTEPLPNVTVLIPAARWVYVNPGAGDDTALIQAAIDAVEATTPDIQSSPTRGAGAAAARAKAAGSSGRDCEACSVERIASRFRSVTHRTIPILARWA